MFVPEANLELINTLGQASFTENSAEITLSSYLTLTDTNDYIPINVKAGVLMTINNYVDSENDSNDQLLSEFMH
jgi:hypothetical protein